MDPSLFNIDYPRLTEVLITIVVFSFFIERALSVLFENRLFINAIDGTSTKKNEDGTPKKKNGVKELIAFIVSVIFCFAWDFDAITIILQSSEEMSVGGMIITGAIIAGGSKASMGLFKNVMGFMSTAEKERQTVRESELKKIS